MASICFYFHVHQPYRIKKYKIFDVGRDQHYFNAELNNLNNKQILNKVADKCYLPTNRLLLELLTDFPEFRVSFSITGVLLEQLETERPDVLDSFKKLVDTGRVEIVAETYYHSLAFLYSVPEFRRQVRQQTKKIQQVFGYKPRVFRNTELIYNNELANEVANMGYIGVLAEGADHIMGWRSPNYVYHPPQMQNVSLLLKNYRLSDDIAFRFSSPDWGERPLTADKFAHWVSAINGNGNVVNLFMDYETFGEHQWEDTGIFSFLRHLPSEILKHPDNDFVTPTEAIQRYQPVAELDIPHFVSWADIERDLSAWRSNDMQYDALGKLYALEKAVMRTKNQKLIEDWRRLQTSDHFYYMCTKWFADGDVHKYFSPYSSPYEAFIAFMNVLQDVKLRLDNKQ